VCPGEYNEGLLLAVLGSREFAYQCFLWRKQILKSIISAVEATTQLKHSVITTTEISTSPLNTVFPDRLDFVSRSVRFILPELHPAMAAS